MPEKYDHFHLCHGRSDGGQRILPGSRKGNGRYSAFPVTPGIVHDSLYADPALLLRDHRPDVVLPGVGCVLGGYGGDHAFDGDEEAESVDSGSGCAGAGGMIYVDIDI